MLEKEEDFSASKSILEEELEKLGARVIFTPKFHPELNPVESCYRYMRIFPMIYKYKLQLCNTNTIVP